ncbi:MAG: glycosyltransferase family 4 protein [Candidatus Thorarchaeota archaeon]
MNMNFFDNKQTKTKGRLRVLFFTPLFTFRHSRTESYLTNEVNALMKNYPNIEFILYVVKTPKRNNLIKINERILRVNRKSYRNFLFLKDMIKIFTKFKPNIVHSHYVVPSIYVNFFAKIFRVPTILHGRGQDVNYYPYYSVKSKILLLIAGKLNKMILTVCKSMKNDCLRFKISKKKVIVLYNGIDFKKFNPKEKIYFSHHRPLELLHVGALSLRKGQHLIIEACKKLKDNNITFHLTLIGDGIQRQPLVDLIKKYELEKHVDLLGWVDYNKIPSYIQKADLLVFPSTTEGLPNAVLEAMSMKLVVVLTKVDGNLELAQKIGSILVDINNPQQLFEAILYYYNNPKEIEIGGEINREFIINSFSWDKHARELYHIYELLANRGRQ